ncbi:hypothetical protein [Ornithinimicrobium cryptoxanthini]|uniref:Transmembrane protein n=1 Tax=Ornithinimicrobium cryptoxanthini TaxID=2934161 RepID=A0ABY4YGQ2_9MICO|nr:hypothetical protein [Ornithinimicrobium cryptoxanthini]USQ75440.1 hypothetical protein NF557_12525 [Ornithinimicrobium cryptoxanthini]
MNPFGDLIEDLRTASQGQLMLRAAVLVSVLAFAVLLVLSGESTLWAVAVLGVLGAFCALNPHTVLPAAIMIYGMAVWWTGVPDPFNPLALPAALSLLLLHTVCALAAAVPAQATLPRELFGQYAVRLAIVSGATTALSLVAWLVVEAEPPGGLVALLVGLLALGLAVGVHYVVVTARPGRRPHESGVG